MKRIFDLSVSLMLIVLFSPLLLVLSILIKLDSAGGIFFLQERLGKNGKVFKIYKFRTMVSNAERIGTGIFTSEDDPRITAIGRFLRKTSLDELPQLLNIVKGDMSFVGPRPPVPYHPYHYENYSGKQKLRFTVLPGITGYAQISGRNNLSWDDRILYDIEYVKNQTFLLDMKIIAMTILSVLRKESIYRSEGNGKKPNL